MTWSDMRPSRRDVERYRAAGVWRDGTPLDDLRRWAVETPQATAITAYRADSGVQRLSYRAYHDAVERFTSVLRDLGVGSGDVVAVRLPNWWQVNALVLATARLDAIAAPVTMELGPRELERVLHRIGAGVCVTTDTWQGTGHGAVLASMAPRLPALRHRVVLGDHVEDGEVDLARAAADTTAPPTVPAVDPTGDPDHVRIVLFTSGTTGAPRGALHTFNTFHAGIAPEAVRCGLTGRDVLFTAAAQTHLLGQQFGHLLPLYLGAEVILTDTLGADPMFSLMAERDATFFTGPPTFVHAVADAARRAGRGLPALRKVAAGATTVPAQLVGEVRRHLGLTLEAAWGMTEVTAATRTSAVSDPPDWAIHSVGRPHAGLEIDLRSDREITAEHPARLLVRGGGVCLALIDRDDDDRYVLADHDDGWYDTGDLAVPDGRGGIRLAGRAEDRVGGVLMIPVSDVEDALRTHPRITDAALVGYGPGNASACAVVVARAPLTLDGVRAYLTDIGMTEWYRPTRLEIVDELPRNSLGKVDKALLRRRLNDEHVSPSPQERNVAMSEQTTYIGSARRVDHHTERWDIEVDTGYEEMIERFERLVPPVDTAAFLAARTWDESLEIAKKLAPMSFMIYSKLPGDGLLKHSHFHGRSVNYLMGNHTIAERMARYDPDVFLYAPLRVLLYSMTPGRTHLAIKRPSSSFSSFDNADIAAVGQELDGLVQDLFAALGAPVDFSSVP